MCPSFILVFCLSLYFLCIDCGISINSTDWVGGAQRPDWYEELRGDEPEQESSEDDILNMGRGARRKSEVKYKEMSEREFDKLCQEGDAGESKKQESSSRPGDTAKPQSR